MVSAPSAGGGGTTARITVGKKYDGCFICGNQEHKAASCPKRWKGESGNESVLLTRVTTAAMDSRNISLGS